MALTLSLSPKALRRALDAAQTKVVTANLAVTTATKMRNAREQREAQIALTAAETNLRLLEIDNHVSPNH